MIDESGPQHSSGTSNFYKAISAYSRVQFRSDQRAVQNVLEKLRQHSNSPLDIRSVGEACRVLSRLLPELPESVRTGVIAEPFFVGLTTQISALVRNEEIPHRLLYSIAALYSRSFIASDSIRTEVRNAARCRLKKLEVNSPETAAEFVSLLDAYVNCSVKPAHVPTKILEKMAPSIQGTDTGTLRRAIWVLAHVDPVPERLINIVLEPLAKVLPTLTLPELVRIISAASNIPRLPEVFLLALADEAVKRRTSLQAVGLVGLTEIGVCLARSHLRNKPFEELLAERSAKCAKDLSFEGLSKLAGVFAALNLPDNKVFSEILRAARSRLRNCDKFPEENSIQNLIESCQYLGISLNGPGREIARAGRR